MKGSRGRQGILVHEEVKLIRCLPCASIVPKVRLCLRSAYGISQCRGEDGMKSRLTALKVEQALDKRVEASENCLECEMGEDI